VKRAYWHIILIFLLVPKIGLSQEYIVTKYTQDDGLPSDYCYNAVQDNEGLLWIATEAGLVTFDGQRFQKNPFSELSTKEIIEVFKDKKGRIWLVDLSGELFYIENGLLSNFAYPDTDENDIFSHICDDLQGNIWFNQRSPAIKICLNVDNLGIIHTTNNKAVELKILQGKDHLFNEQYCSLLEDDLHIKSGTHEILFPNFNLTKMLNTRVKFENGIWLFAYENRLYKYDQKNKNIQPILNQYISYFDIKIDNIAKDKHNNLWVAAKKGFLRISNPLSNNSQIKEYFIDAKSGDIFIDNQDNFWFTTLDQGIIK